MKKPRGACGKTLQAPFGIPQFFPFNLIIPFYHDKEELFVAISPR